MGDSRKSVPDPSARQPHLRWLVAAACVFTAALMLPLAWHVLHSFHVSQTITESYMAGEELRDAIYHANAELILDARSTVLGDSTAGPKHRGACRERLRGLLDRAQASGPTGAGAEGLARADSLQRVLRDAEAAAVGLALNGLPDEALALLTSPRYASDHECFHAALDDYAAACKAQVRQAVEAERREEMRIVAVAGGILAVSVAVWIVLVRMLERWRQGLLLEARERRAAEEHLGNAQKMECVGRLAAGIAHDFGNLLLAISGFALVGRRRLPAGHAAADSLVQIETAAAQATNLTRSLLHFANRPAGAARPTELREVVRATLELLEPSLPGSVVLDGSRCAGEPLWVQVDPHRLQQALLNLGLNARDALSEGGRIDIAITVEGEAAGRAARVAVTDDGPGIDEKVRRHLGEPFFTTRTGEGGCGLGLFSVRTFAREYRGRLEIASNLGCGSTFSLVLPLRSPPVRAPAAPRPSLPAADRVLLVGCDGVVRGLVADSLRAYGFSVNVAGDVPGAAAFLAAPGGCEVAVIDGDLPDGTAETCVALVSGAAPGAALVLVRGEAPAPPNLRTGTVVARPFTMPELCEAVAEAACAARRAAEAQA